MTTKVSANAPVAVPAAHIRVRNFRSDLSAHGEPFNWALGGALAFGIVLIVGFLLLVFWNGISTFYPKPIEVIRTVDGTSVAGAVRRDEVFRLPAAQLAELPPAQQARIRADDGYVKRRLVQIGNYDLYNEDFRWVSEYQIESVSTPPGLFFIERVEWGPFVGRIKQISLDGRVVAGEALTPQILDRAHGEARDRWWRLRELERGDIGTINHHLDEERLALRRLELRFGQGDPRIAEATRPIQEQIGKLQAEYKVVADQVTAVRQADIRNTITLTDVNGREKELPLSGVTRFVAANDLGLFGKLGVYFGRWWEFLADEPREANTEGGVMPAIFGTFVMTLLMVIIVAPFGVITALYLREYAKQGRIVSIVRISVNNLAGVPSIVYGVFGLGFFAYLLGGGIDGLFYPERLPNPTFGTGGILWASLTLALLTVPVVIVATEEALAAVPRSMREGSLACGASKWQTIRNIVLPRAMPGIMTGLILAMARGAGEVAPLMLVGVVKLAPELPIDGFFPFIHLERSFMHLGFHIYDVGFQSRNSEAGKPMVFVTTMLLIGLIFIMNIGAIMIRSRLKRRFAGSQF